MRYSRVKAFLRSISNIKPVPFRYIVGWTPSSTVLMRASVHGLLRAGWLRFLVSAADFLSPLGMEEPSMIKFPLHISQSWPWCPRSYKPSKRWTGCKHALRECKASPTPQDSWTHHPSCARIHTHTHTQSSHWCSSRGHSSDFGGRRCANGE